MTYCHVSAQIDRYLDREAKADARQNAISERATELQRPGNECDPLNAKNFDEALAGANFAEVVALYREGDDLAAGQALRQMSECYWKSFAEDIAEERLDEEIERSKDDAAAEAYEWHQYEANH